MSFSLLKLHGRGNERCWDGECSNHLFTHHTRGVNRLEMAAAERAAQAGARTHGRCRRGRHLDREDRAAAGARWCTLSNRVCDTRLT